MTGGRRTRRGRRHPTTTAAVFAADWLATARAGLRPEAAAAAVAIATLSGAWCPSLSPDGDRGRLRHRPVRLAARSRWPPVTGDGAGADRLRAWSGGRSRSAWSPDGEWLAYLVSPGGSIRAELHVVRPDGTDRRVLAGDGIRDTVFAGLWTPAPGWYAYSLADGESPHVGIRMVEVATGDVRRWLPSAERLGFVTLTGISADGSTAVVRIGPRNRRRLYLLADARARRQARPAAARRPEPATTPARTAASRRMVAASTCGHRPAGTGWRWATCHWTVPGARVRCGSWPSGRTPTSSSTPCCRRSASPVRRPSVRRPLCAGRVRRRVRTADLELRGRQHARARRLRRQRLAAGRAAGAGTAGLVTRRGLGHRSSRS